VRRIVAVVVLAATSWIGVGALGAHAATPPVVSPAATTNSKGILCVVVKMIDRYACLA
jgi:hypothetical protein